MIGTIRRECLDHVIIFSETGLSCHLRRFADYYHRSRTHLGLQKDTPELRPVQAPEAGRIVAIPEVGIIATNVAPPESSRAQHKLLHCQFIDGCLCDAALADRGDLV